MEAGLLLTLLKQRDFEQFRDVLARTTLSEADRQELLCDIIEAYYSHKEFGEFKKVFDVLIGDHLNLNFEIDHWAPSFLSLVILRWPLIELLDYFIRKGADINFVADSFAFLDVEDIKQESQTERYQTCLDFAQMKLDDRFTSDYHFGLPEGEPEQTAHEIDDQEEIKVNKAHYLYLVEQSHYLKDLVHTDKVIAYLKSLGAKRAEELQY